MFDGVEKERIAQILLGITHLILTHPQHFWNGKPQLREMTRHINKCPILIAVRSYNADDGLARLIRLPRINSIGPLLFH